MDNQAKTRMATLRSALTALLILLACTGFACGMLGSVGQAYAESTPGSATTTIYFTNDVHGNFGYAQQTNGMSYATVKALKTAGNAGDNKAYLVDAGDHISGSAYANFDLGGAVLDIMKTVGYDFRVPGNHEFDYGSDNFLTNVSQQATYYACNFYSGSPTQRGENILESYKVLTGANGETIALIGIMTPETISASAPGYFQDNSGNWVMFIDSAQTATTIYDQLNTTISEIKTTYGPETICIAVGHLGNESSAVQAGVDSATVIQHSSGLSAFIDGHSHTIENTTVADADGNNIPLLQAASGIDAVNTAETTGINRIGSLTIAADGTIAGEILAATNGEYTEVTPDAEVKQKENANLTTVDNALSSAVSTNSIEFASAAKTIQRGKSNSLADFVTDGMYYYVNEYADSTGTTWGCDAVMVNGGGIRGTLATGTDTVKSFLDVLPFINRIVVIEATGQQILDALEYGAKDVPTGTFGGFMQTSGMTYTINTSISSTIQMKDGVWAGPPTGAYRVQNVQIYDKDAKKFVDIDLEKTYKLAGLDYNVGNYGDGFMMFLGSDKHADYNDKLTYQILVQYAMDFQNGSSASLPEITTANSPLSTVEGFPLNYESQDGSGRIAVGKQFVQMVDENGRALAGAVLKIVDGAGREVRTWTSGIGFEGLELEAGTYTLSEETAPQGYAKTGDIVLTVTSDGGITIDGQEVANSTIKMVGKKAGGENDTPLIPETGDSAAAAALGFALMAACAGAAARKQRQKAA